MPRLINLPDDSLCRWAVEVILHPQADYRLKKYWSMLGFQTCPGREMIHASETMEIPLCDRIIRWPSRKPSLHGSPWPIDL